MTRLDLEQLAEAVRGPAGLELSSGARLQLPSAPQPFIPPKLVPTDSALPDSFAAEVIIISSPAAVGKSTVAAYLSAANSVPLLNLAEVHVSTSALVGLLATDIVKPAGAIDALHEGQLTIIVDALDEGRLLSGDANFEAFLETTWELLLRDRSVTNRPKLILFGRDIAADLVDLSLKLSGNGISVSWLTLDFFDHDDATAVIEAHALETARSDGRSWSTSGPAKEVVAAFFDAIEGALRLEKGTLWQDREGKAFAGYAPVLAAIGSLLSREQNPARLKTALQHAGAERAWEVIVRVAEAILEREREEKVRPQLAREISGDVPPEAYDAQEQLTYLTQLAHGKPLRVTGRVPLTGRDAEIYRRMIEQHLPEHPFLQQGRLANEVLASIVLAYAVEEDLLYDTDLLILREASRQPFLWRSVQRLLERDGSGWLVGSYVGCVLNSLWNDSIIEEVHVSARPSAEDSDVAHIVVRESRNVEWSIDALHPLELYEQIRDCDFLLEASTVWQGHDGKKQGFPSFDLRGNLTFIVNGDLDIRASSVRIDGDARLMADGLSQQANLQVTLTPRSGVWWGGQFAETYPWNDYRSTLEPPIEIYEPTELELLVKRCAAHMPGSPSIILYRNFYPTDDRRFAWVEREFSAQKFSQLVRLMVDHGFARAEPAQASGPDPKVRIHFNVTWDRLLRALRSPRPQDSDLAELVGEARRVLGEVP